MDTMQANQEAWVEAYLQRIDSPITAAALSATCLENPLQTLAMLQERHLQTVPYENLDILQGVPLSLEIPNLVDKIVHRHRGGYCFELNALFGWLLRKLGYPVTSLMARFWRDEPNPPPKRRHHVLKVEVDGKPYLFDVGVGGVIPRRPLLIEDGLVQPQGDESYRLTRDTDFGWMLWELRHGEWQKLYSFSEEPQLERDFIMATYWCEHAPDSIFTQAEMIAIHTPDGRKTVAGREFRIFGPNGVDAFTPASDEDYKAALQKHFGIRL